MSSLEKLKRKKTPTLVELTAVSNYKNTLVVKHYANMNLHKAFSTKTPSIGALSKLNETKAILCISNLFIATSKYFDKELSPRQSEVIAEEIIANYQYRQLKLEDILAICIEIKQSDTFKLTPARILRFITDYTKRREKLAIERSMQLATSTKNSVNYDLESRLQKHFKSLPDANRIASKRNTISKRFK